MTISRHQLIMMEKTLNLAKHGPYIDEKELIELPNPSDSDKAAAIRAMDPLMNPIRKDIISIHRICSFANFAIQSRVISSIRLSTKLASSHQGPQSIVA